MNMRDRQCRTCGITFKGGPRAWYCPSCRIERRRKADREHMKRARKGLVRKLGSVDKCEVCGNDFIVASGLQRMCSDCKNAEYRRIDRELSLKYYEENKGAINPIRNKRRRKKRVDES